MSRDGPGRAILLVYVAVSLVVLIAGSVAGMGTYAFLFDNKTDDAGTISFVDTGAVSYINCKKANVTASNPRNFDMTVVIENDTSYDYNESDFVADEDFIYDTKDYFSNPAPEIVNITLDGTTYESPQNCG